MRTPASVLVVALAIAAGCGGATAGLGGGVRRAPLDAGAQSKFQAEVTAGDTAYAARADRAQLEAAIAHYAAATQIKDDDWQTYEKLAHAYYVLADGWLFFDG